MANLGEPPFCHVYMNLKFDWPLVYFECVLLDILVGHLRELHGKWPCSGHLSIIWYSTLYIIVHVRVHCSISRPHYLANVEHTPPALLSSLELEFHRVERWMLSRLRSAVWEVEHALRQTSDAPHSTGTAAAAPAAVAVSVAHKHDGT